MGGWLTCHITSRSAALSWQIEQQHIRANRTNRLCLEITTSFSKCTSVINPEHVRKIHWSQAEILGRSHPLYLQSNWTLFRILRPTLWHLFQDRTKQWIDSSPVAEQLRNVAWSDRRGVVTLCSTCSSVIIRGWEGGGLRSYIPLLNLQDDSSLG
jgi:hypothetical protein